MIRLAALLFSLLSAAFAGTAVVIALVAGFVSLPALLAAALTGTCLAAPASLMLARRLYDQ